MTYLLKGSVIVWCWEVNLCLPVQFADELESLGEENSVKKRKLNLAILNLNLKKKELWILTVTKKVQMSVFHISSNPPFGGQKSNTALELGTWVTKLLVFLWRVGLESWKSLTQAELKAHGSDLEKKSWPEFDSSSDSLKGLCTCLHFFPPVTSPLLQKTSWLQLDSEKASPFPTGAGKWWWWWGFSLAHHSAVKPGWLTAAAGSWVVLFRLWAQIPYWSWHLLTEAASSPWDLR